MPDGNPYARMLSAMWGESGKQIGADGTGGAVKMRLGIVAQREPLEIIVAGIRQPTEALKVNERLAKGAKWKTKVTAPVDVLNDQARRPAGIFTNVRGPVSGTVACSGMGCAPELTEIMSGTLCSSDVLINQTEQEQLEIDLEKGDTVLMLTEDDQVFYILMKVVDAV